MNYIHRLLNNDIKNEQLDVLAVLEYPFVDIELTARDYESDGTLIYDYFCCVNETGKENGWESYDGIEFGEVDPKEFTTEKELMEDMRKQLFDFCNKNNLRIN